MWFQVNYITNKLCHRFSTYNLEIHAYKKRRVNLQPFQFKKLARTRLSEYLSRLSLLFQWFFFLVTVFKYRFGNNDAGQSRLPPLKWHVCLQCVPKKRNTCGSPGTVLEGGLWLIRTKMWPDVCTQIKCVICWPNNKNVRSTLPEQKLE